MQFEPEQYNQTIEVFAVNDSVSTVNPIVITVQLLSTSESNLGVNKTTIYVNDDGAAGVIMFDTYETIILENAGVLSVTLQRSNGSDGNATAIVASSLSAALTESPIEKTVFFDNGISFASVNFSVRNTDEYENRKFTLQLINATSGSSVSPEVMRVNVVDKGDISLAGAPRVSLVNVSGGMISVVWDPPSYLGGPNGTILAYHVKLQTNNGSQQTFYAKNETTYQVFDLLNDTMYVIEVAGANQRGIGEYSEPLSVITTAPVHPGPVKAFSLTDVSGGKFQLSWSYPIDKGGGSLVLYRISVLNQNLNTTRVIQVPSTTLNMSIGDLVSNTLYNVSVVAVNEALLEGVPVMTSTMTLGETPPSQPPQPSIVNATGGALNLNVFAPVDCGGSYLISYTVYYARHMSWLITYQTYGTYNVTNKSEDGSIGMISVFGLLSHSKYLIKISIANEAVRTLQK